MFWNKRVNEVLDSYKELQRKNDAQFLEAIDAVHSITSEFFKALLEEGILQYAKPLRVRQPREGQLTLVIEMQHEPVYTDSVSGDCFNDLLEELADLDGEYSTDEIELHRNVAVPVYDWLDIQWDGSHMFSFFLSDDSHESELLEMLSMSDMYLKKRLEDQQAHLNKLQTDAELVLKEINKTKEIIKQ